MCNAYYLFDEISIRICVVFFFLSLLVVVFLYDMSEVCGSVVWKWK